MAKILNGVCLFLGVIIAMVQAEVEIQNGVAALSPAADDHDLGGAVAEAPAMIRRLGKHHSTDKSVAGGGVIIGGLVTAIFAAVFCYIRVTRRKDNTVSGGHI